MTKRTKLWDPSKESIEKSEIFRFQRWLAEKHGVHTESYAELHAWTVENIDDFWDSVWKYFNVIGERGAGSVRTGPSIQNTTWFPGAKLNYAENLLRHSRNFPNVEAVVGLHETSPRSSLTWSQLTGQVGALAHRFRQLGLRPGDTVCAVLPNIPQTIVVLLATAAVGAIWSVVNTDFGVQGISDRFAQIDPKLLITVDGFEYNDQYRDQLPQLAEIAHALPTFEHHLLIDSNITPDTATPQLPVPTIRLSEVVAKPREPEFEQLEFSHPLWVLYSSGTTGKPKGIVHSHGGIVLEALKTNALQHDILAGERVYYAVSTTWVVWNLLVNSMMRGATVITYDGAITHGTPAKQLEICSEEDVSFFGTGAGILRLMEKSGVSPKDYYSFPSLRFVLSTGSPLPESTWTWVYEHVKNDLRLSSDSGGTDICSGILGSNPLDAVYVNEMQGPYLGVAAAIFNEAGQPVIDEVGELVITEPLPSMPVKFWNDPNDSRYLAAYFEAFDGVWCHSDWATNYAEGGWEVHGRSDSTINRGGIRMGSADITNVVDQVPGVQASMVIGAELTDGNYYMPLFVVPKHGVRFDDELRETIVHAIRSNVSPRYIPDEIIPAPSVPRTRTGKLMEIPVKRVFQGADAETINRETAEDPEIIDWYVHRALAFNKARSRAEPLPTFKR